MFSKHPCLKEPKTVIRYRSCTAKGQLLEEVTEAKKENGVVLRELEKKPVPIHVLATPKTTWKVNRLYEKVAHARHRELRC